MKTSASQLHSTANKLGNSKSTIGRDAVIDGFRSRPRSKKKLGKSRKSTIPDNSRAMEELQFLTSGIGEVFNLLRQAFRKALIFRYFNVECHIQIEIDISGYAIGNVLI